MDQETDVVVVGAGLAGLRCALELERAGLDVVVLEAADAVGGRIRTEEVDGFLLDRGFQLLNPAYPELEGVVDVPALGLQPFGAGVVALTDGAKHLRLGHPLHAPRLLGSTLLAGGRRPGELAAMLRWARPLLTPRRHRRLADVLAARPARTRREALDRVGADGVLRRVVERFLAGVLLEDDGSTADDYAQLLLWMFVRATPGLPRAGMAALPHQLAARLTRPVHLDTAAEVVSGRRVRAAGTTYAARAVVVATGAPDAATLLRTEVPGTRGVSTAWWSAPEPPPTHALLHVDARTEPGGPVVNCAVVSDAAPSYAPPGAHLVQASALLAPGRAVPEAELRRHAGEILGADPSGWELLRRHDVVHALPAQPAPFSARRPVDLGDGRFVCGDHRDTASIQGALVSGRRAAAAVVASLGPTPGLSPGRAPGRRAPR
ncbi:flavin monoamine oxidase family protein [Nocardioides dongxiaopingii]|uniref:flavin monoamine oxidase family protein n=1 Tax=Nocardioides dongxiaopingii TaxID=2576036 RepID=UPI001BB02C56|nr:FAD-dependent oxidoreductase [Nocardioides dongxiaopingii]